MAPMVGRQWSAIKSHLGPAGGPLLPHRRVAVGRSGSPHRRL